MFAPSHHHPRTPSWLLPHTTSDPSYSHTPSLCCSLTLTLTPPLCIAPSHPHLHSLTVLLPRTLTLTPLSVLLPHPHIPSRVCSLAPSPSHLLPVFAPSQHTLTLTTSLYCSFAPSPSHLLPVLAPSYHHTPSLYMCLLPCTSTHSHCVCSIILSHSLLVLLPHTHTPFLYCSLTPSPSLTYCSLAPSPSHTLLAFAPSHPHPHTPSLCLLPWIIGDSITTK